MKRECLSASSVCLTVCLGLLAGCAPSTSPDAAKPAASDAPQAPEARAKAPDATPQQVMFVSFAPTKAPTAGGHCALDIVNGAAAKDATIVSGQPVTLGGWLTANDLTVPQDARIVMVSASDRFAASFSVNVQRPDVAQALGKPEATLSGFNLNASIEALPPGDYAVSASFGGDQFACQMSDKLSIKPKN